MNNHWQWYSQQIRAILILPFTVTVIIPVILWFAERGPGEKWKSWPLLIAIPPGIVGVTLLVWTIGLFMRIGRGTLAPWNPPRKLVTTGPYAYTRNPMLSGVFMILLAEAIGGQSVAIACWFGIFVMSNVIHFMLSEEPGLRRRFGSEYEEYYRNVPRFLPRLTPWRPR